MIIVTYNRRKPRKVAGYVTATEDDDDELVLDVSDNHPLMSHKAVDTALTAAKKCID